MATKKTTLPAPKPVDFEISERMVLDESWTYRVNGELVTWTEYNRLSKEHEQWLAEQAAAVAKANEPEKQTKRKKSK